jgi:integrase/recombinase XerC
MQQFLQYLASEKRSSLHTIAAYRSDLEQFSAFIQLHFEVEDLLSVTTMMVRSWISHWMDQGMAVSTVHRKVSSLQAYYRFERKQGRLMQNPLKGIAKPKKPSILPQYLEVAQAEQIYQPIEEGWEPLRNAVILRMLYETGMRRSELLGIQVKDIDWSKGQVRVLGKRNKIRVIPISPALIQELKALKELNLTVSGTNPFLFLNLKGEVLSAFQLYQLVKKQLSQWTTMKKRSPHILRHSFASHMLNQGADLNVIKEILGHSSLAATQVYTHLNIEKLKGIHQMLHPRNEEGETGR